MDQVMIKDVAERVGVLISTVSRALNAESKEYMRPETEEWVLQVIREVDYNSDINEYKCLHSEERAHQCNRVLALGISNPLLLLTAPQVENVAYRHNLSCPCPEGRWSYDVMM